MSEDLRTLEGTLDTVWIHMANAARQGQTVTLATIGTDGPSARLVVLRSADRSQNMMTIWTHRNSAKVDEIAADSRAEILYWDPLARFQIRLNVDITVHDGSLTVWKGFNDDSRRNYAPGPNPGTPTDVPEMRPLSSDASMFAEIRARVRRIDTVWLGEELHRRALFTENDTTWLVP